jgi:hypothetical protein
MNECRFNTGDPSQACLSLQKLEQGACADIPRSARYEHDNTRESTGGNPPSGHQNPELPRLALFTPRDKTEEQAPSGEEPNTENQSWICAFN